MSSSCPVLLDIGSDAYSHQSDVDEVKQRLGVTHNYFDCWIFGFLENKNFNVNDAVSKLQRRADFEREQLASYNVTDWMMENMRKGIIQVIGNDKAGRVTFYICTARDKPVATRRDESRMNFDMFVSYGTRLRPESKRCQMTMLINQDKASMMGNLDITFQADIALRIAKFYPGCVDKMYICKMNRLLSTLAKPIFSRLPAIVSDRIIIMSDGDIKNGKLLELFDENVLPTALGGKNDCDNQENYDRFAHLIRDYFDQLKAAVIRGESVKEWELNNLKLAGYAGMGTPMEVLKRSIIDLPTGIRDAAYLLDEPTRPSIVENDASWSCTSMEERSYSRPIDVDDDANLVTCDSVTAETKPVRLTSNNEINNRSSLIRGPSITYNTSRDLFIDYVNQFITLEAFFRISMTEMYEREWLAVVRMEVTERKRLLKDVEILKDDRFLSSLPPSILLIAKGFLWLCLMVVSFYFLIGTCFIALLGVVTLTYLFFAMFCAPYNVFLYGAAFVVVATQFTIFCSRGFDVMRNTFQGRRVQALQAFGNRALLFQLVISVMATVGLFAFFCVMATRYDTLTGLQYSLAYGWILAVCIIFIYHALFAFGFKTIRKQSYGHGSRVNHAEGTLYFFLDMEIDDDPPEERCPPAEVILLSIIAVLSIAAGVAFLVGGGFFFLCAAVVVQSVLLLLCIVYMSAANVGATSDITISGVFYATIFWMDAIFTLSQHGWTSDWGNSILAVLFIMIFFVITGMITVYGPWKGAVRRWLFRTSWILLLLHLIGCTVSLLVLNYRVGLFIMALALHLMLCIVRTNEASNRYGVCMICIFFTIAVLTCCLFGKLDIVNSYSHSVSTSMVPDYATNYTTVPTTLLPPICHLKFTDDVDILGMSLFAKLGQNADAGTQAEDLARWFPAFHRVELSSAATTDLIVFNAFRRETETRNTTVITARTGQNLQASIASMTMWIGIYAVSFLNILMPSTYVESVIRYTSFLQHMVPRQWTASVDDVTSALQAYVEGLNGTEEELFFTGNGLSGALGAVIGLQTNDSIYCTTFSSPTILPQSFGMDFTLESLSRRLLVVKPVESVLATWYWSQPDAQVIPCTAGGRRCDTMDYAVEKLQKMCWSGS